MLKYTLVTPHTIAPGMFSKERHQIKLLISHTVPGFGSFTSLFFNKVYKSDPFRDLSLGAQYALTVMALPVPEQWERFYHSEIFSTRCKIQKPGTDRWTDFKGGGGIWGLIFNFIVFIFSMCREERARQVQQRCENQLHEKKFLVMWIWVTLIFLDFL